MNYRLPRPPQSYESLRRTAPIGEEDLARIIEDYNAFATDRNWRAVKAGAAYEQHNVDGSFKFTGRPSISCFWWRQSSRKFVLRANWECPFISKSDITHAVLRPLLTREKIVWGGELR